MSREEFLDLLTRLRRASVGNVRAPHKPLLLLWLFGRFAAAGSTAATYAEAEEPVSTLINDFGPPVAKASAGRQRAAMPFVHLEREIWDLRDGSGAEIGLEQPRLVDVKFERAQTWAVAVAWGEFEQAQPGLAEAGRTLLYQFGVGLAFLATVRRDGGPRVHPMCPLIYQGGLYAFIVPGPKQDDLHRDGRYSLHSFPCEDNEDAFYCTGRAHAVEDPATRQALAELFVTERSGSGVPVPAANDHLFSFGLQRCLLTRTTGHGDSSPQHTVWHQAST